MDSSSDTHYQLLGAENELLERASKKVNELHHSHAKRHIHEGFVRRHMMMQKSRVHIYHKIRDQEEKPLDPYLATELMIYLNSYYFNLCGAFDNLAWALTWELSLLNDIKEGGKGNARRFVNLFGKKFLNALRDLRPQVVDQLERYADWMGEVKEFRDPAAHRIPLCFSGSTLNEDDYEKYQDLKAQATATYQEAGRITKQERIALEQGDMDRYWILDKESNDLLDEGFDLEFEADQLGRFIPLILTSEESGHEFRLAPDQLEQDQTNFLSISRLILAEGF